ncbi:unnamed protein product, partial [Rotaria magnacalcarata]
MYSTIFESKLLTRSTMYHKLIIVKIDELHTLTLKGSTDIFFALGIDIDDVSLVINYDMPVTTDFKPDYETYLHRIGRCSKL